VGVFLFSEFLGKKESRISIEPRKPERKIEKKQPEKPMTNEVGES
jgi:hypothetical protein